MAALGLAGAAAAILMGFTVLRLLETGTVSADGPPSLPSEDIEDVAREELVAADVWAGHGPLNVLLIGVDAGLDEGCREGSYKLSDTIILVRFDPTTKKAGLMTIPRDLFVYIDGYGGRKITTAHAIGGNRGDDGGPELLKQTIQKNLELPVHRHVRVDLQGFERLVDELGGVDITVPAAQGNPELGLYDADYPDGKCGTMVVEFKPGTQHLGGAEALQYARSRKTTSDFDRSRRQLDVLMAIRERAVDPGVLTRVRGLVPALLDTVDTDFTIREIGSLSLSATDVNRDNILRFPIDANVVYDQWVIVDQVPQAVLRLQPQPYRELKTRFMNLSPPPTPTPEPTPISPSTSPSPFTP